MKTNNSLNYQLGSKESETICRIAKNRAYHYFHVNGQNDLDDLIQEAYLKILVGLHLFNPELGKFYTWAYTVIENHFKSLAEKEYQRRLHPISFTQQDKDDEESEYELAPSIDVMSKNATDEMLLAEDMQNRIDKVLEHRNKDAHKYLRLSADGYRNNEIAAMCGDSEGNVAIKIHRAKQALRSDLYLKDI